MSEALAIGRLATLTGLPVTTIRFYSDAGLLPPSGRTEAGHRRYRATDVARLQLVRALRELEVDLPAIGQLLAGRGHPAPGPGPGPAGRGRAGPAAGPLLGPPDRGAGGQRGGRPAAGRRPPELPEHPTPEQLDAWLELAELVLDQDDQHTTRANARWGAEAAGDGFDPDPWTRRLAGGLAAAAVVEPMVRGLAGQLGRRHGPVFRRWLIGQLDAHTDPRVVRYWQLVGIIQGRPEAELAAHVADHTWLLAALHHHTGVPAAPAR